MANQAEKPLAFTAAMVRAWRSGTKTQTRRLMRMQPLDILPMKGDKAGKQWIVLAERGKDVGKPENTGAIIRCRYGCVGDRIWGREAWRASKSFDGVPPRDMPPGAEIWYEATSNAKEWRETVGRLRPPMFMMRWMSRMELDIVAIRAQRVQDITRKDAIAEGVHEWAAGAMSPAWRDMDPRDLYARLWNTINPAAPFESNPWVWAITFPKHWPA